MTGKELIIYILENDLEDEELLSGGLKPLFMTAEHAAVRWDCGAATVKAMIDMGRVRGIKLGNEYFVFAMEPNPFKKNERAD